MNDFLKYLKEAKADFVDEVNRQNWDKELRKNAENLIIAYDQLYHKYKDLLELTTKPNDLHEAIQPSTHPLEKNVIDTNISVQERIDIVNALILYISILGRRFFFSDVKCKTAKIILKNNFVYFIDHYSRHEIPLHLSAGLHWRNFSGGGTLKGLVLDFYDFISTGKKSNGNNGYGGLHSPHWGYSEFDMQKIQKLATSLGYL